MTEATTGFAALEETLLAKRTLVEEALARLAPRGRAPQVESAAAYSLFAPAKRLRPVLSLLVAAVRRATRMALAMEARGLGARSCRTSARISRMRGSDWAWIAVRALTG